ncbi:hypothetical protein ACHWQZ_G003582 [Mnemiopsis leidyi]
MTRHALIAILLTLADCCQEIRVKSLDGGVVVGRSMEFSLPLNSHLVSEPAGTVHQAPLPPNCHGNPVTFTNRFKTISNWNVFAGKWANSLADGVNEAGVSVSILWFKGYEEYLDPTDITGAACDSAIPHTKIGAYILAKYENVEQVKEDLESGKFPAIWGGTDLNMVPPIHFNIIDKTGAGLVLEHTKGEGVKWYDNTVGVLTNSPPYPWHMTNLRSYPHFQRNDKGREGFQYSSLGDTYTLSQQWTGSGLLGLPGDYTSPSRFIKAATLLSLAPKPATTDEAIVQVFHHMNAADIPYGIVETGPENRVSLTSWILVKDLGRGCVYYRAYTDLSVKRLCLHNLPDVRSAVRIEGNFDGGFRDTSGELQEIDNILLDKHTEL